MIEHVTPDKAIAALEQYGGTSGCGPSQRERNRHPDQVTLRCRAGRRRTYGGGRRHRLGCGDGGRPWWLGYRGGGRGRLAELRRLHRVTRFDFWIAMAAIIGVLSAGVLAGVVIGVVLSLGWLIYVTTRPPMRLLGREAGTQVFRDLDANPGDETFPGITVLRLARVKPNVLKVIQANGFVDMIGEDHIHGNVNRAIEAQVASDGQDETLQRRPEAQFQRAMRANRPGTIHVHLGESALPAVRLSDST